MKILKFSLIVLLVLASCKKKYEVTGRVFNVVTKEGLANVEVLFTPKIKSEEDPGKVEKQVSVTTDVNGLFVLETRANIRKAHRVNFVGLPDSNYFIIGETEKGLYSRNKSHRVDVGFARFKGCVFHMNDSTQYSTNSEKFLSVEFRHRSVPGFYANQKLYLKNFLQFPNVPNPIPLLEGWTYMKFESKRNNGQIIYFNDSIFVDMDTPGSLEYFKSY